jgi:hypothetical protein
MLRIFKMQVVYEWEKCTNSGAEEMKSETPDHVSLEVHGLIVLHPDYTRSSTAISSKRDVAKFPDQQTSRDISKRPVYKSNFQL